MTSYRGISVRNPLAHLILEGVKDIENKHYAYPADAGTLLIHASKSTADVRADQWGPVTRAAMRRLGYGDGGQCVIDDLADTFGMVIGAVDVVKVHTNGKSKSPWAVKDAYDTTFHWELQNPRRLKNPFPWRGQTSLLIITPPSALKFV